MMTPERAQEVISQFLKDFGGKLSDWDSDPLENARGFLQGVAYQEEKVKGLVEALEYYRDLDDGKNPKNLPEKAICPIAAVALATYKARINKLPLEDRSGNTNSD